MFSFPELFGGYVSEDVCTAFAEVRMDNCILKKESREFELSVFSEKYIPRSTVLRFKNEVKAVLQLNAFDLLQTFAPDAFCSDACADITDELRISNPALNGYFNAADYTLDGNTVTVTLKYGGLSNIKDNEFEKQFCSVVSKRFSRSVTVVFDGQLENIEIKLPPEEKSDASHTPIRFSAPKTQRSPRDISFEKRDDIPENGLAYLDDPRLFYGRSIDNNVKAMIDITEDDSEICCFGEVFGYDIRKINTRRGERNIVKFSFSDHTNSLNASMFMDPEKMGDIAPIKNGAYILVNGKYEFDDFRHEYIVNPKAIALLQPYEERDTHDGEKRVELHCHTNMSANDAVSSAGDIIKRAYKWGHKAVAITDHGVVQSYPAAAAAVAGIRKGGGEFKVIYGVESYFVDDINNNVEGLNAKQLARYRHHQIILVKNLKGLKNLYRLISEAHVNDFKGKPITYRSKLDKLREGLIVGSACEQGELYKAVVDGKDHDELVRIASYYDYLEIQPIGNNAFMVRESSLPDKTDKKTGQVIPNRFRNVTSVEVIKDFNRKIVEIADELGKPVVATGDVHFLKKTDGVIRQIVMAGQGFDDIGNQAPLYFKTTDEMLGDFDYFGDRAKEFVIDNPNKIADMISGDVIPVPEGNYPPVIRRLGRASSVKYAGTMPTEFTAIPCRILLKKGLIRSLIP